MQSLIRVARHPSTACLATGFLLGQIVLALAAQHQHRLMGLGYALVFIGAGAASLACFLKHQHAQTRPASEKAPLNAWLMLLGLAVLLSLSLPQMLA